jgi:hypothetical protein
MPENACDFWTAEQSRGNYIVASSYRLHSTISTKTPALLELNQRARTSTAKLAFDCSEMTKDAEGMKNSGIFS